MMSSHSKSELIDKIIDCNLAAQDTATLCLELAGALKGIKAKAEDAAQHLRLIPHDYHSVQAIKKIEEIVLAV